jgi:D-glycero-D-manno-heptose 1,7-bisphosphate phosphatase
MDCAMTSAVFLDRDGVLIEDVDLLTRAEGMQILAGVPSALSRLTQAAYQLIVVTNQPVIARGLLTEAELEALHGKLQSELARLGAPSMTAFFYCPHHPQATLEAYRQDCLCRKPRPGMLLEAARRHQIDLSSSFMVGDRITDIIAGARAGCRTILVQTGRHLAPPIATREPIDVNCKPDWTCAGLEAAADWILLHQRPMTS